MNSNIKGNEKFLGADLHIHTPASNCYRGKKDDDEYLSILRRYFSKNIRIIAITDHNTIKGYKKLMEIRQNLGNEIAILEKYYKKYNTLRSEYDKAKKDFELFESMLIMPGIEFEANPGIHLLLIFDPKCDLSKLENFLTKAGYPDESRGQERIDTSPCLDIIGTLHQAHDLGALIIAAHADSDKGIYQALKGQYRASIFKSPYLNAISYNNPSTCEKMKDLLENKDYKRDSPIAFIQSSDYHGEGEPGSSITYLKSDDLSFESIKEAFKNPNEYISPTQHPDIINILHQIITDHKTFTFENFGDKQIIQNTICAILNESYGTLVIGATSNKSSPSIIGVNINHKECEEITVGLLDGINPSFNKEVSYYTYGHNRNVVVIKVYGNIHNIYYLNNYNTFFLNDSIVEKATPPQIEKNIERRMHNKMLSHQRILESKYDSIIKELKILSKSSQQFILINKIEKHSYRIKDIVNLEFIKPFKSDITPDNPNGYASGNLIFLDLASPRLSDAYLRCSSPKLNRYDINKLGIQKFSKNGIIIVPGGGAYIVGCNDEWGIVTEYTTFPTLLLTIKDKFKKRFSKLALLVWFKSTMFLWYNQTMFDNVNMYIPSIFNRTVVPALDIFMPDSIIEHFALEILEEEYNLLSVDTDSFSNDTYGNLIKDHNNKIDNLALEIDQAIFNSLNIELQDKVLMHQLMEYNNIYNLNSNNKNNPNIQNEIIVNNINRSNII